MENATTGIVTIGIHATATKVWDGLTNPAIIKQYFFGTDAESTWQEGSPVFFRGEWEGESYEDKGTILISEPHKILRYNYWSSMSGKEDIPGNYRVITYELFEEEGDTMLTITQSNLASEKDMEDSVQNWRKVMNDMKELLENPAIPEEEPGVVVPQPPGEK